MASPVEICSVALTLIGVDTITDLAEDSPRARLCNLHYQAVVDELIREAQWNCSLFRQTLAQLTTSPGFDFGYAYQLPTDPYCLRVWRTSVDKFGGRWEVEGRTLVADDQAIAILYGGRLTDPTLFDSLFRSALTYRLAAKFAYPLTGKLRVAEDMNNLYEVERKRAATADGQEGSIRSTTTTALTEVR